jgi:uncharacterized protein YdaU (DUF1376 family)
MAEQPWFKFFAADYLLDSDVDAMSREAEALLLRMWCICHREGSCPVDVETLARKTQCSQEYVLRYKPQCEPFFELRDDKLYSRRMEEEKRRSKQASENANKRYHKQSAVQTAMPTALPRSDSDSDSEFEFGFKNPPPFKKSVVALKENARAREEREALGTLALPRKSYSPAVGDAIDLRKFRDAREKLELKLAHGWGSNLTDDQIFEQQCALAGISVERALEVTKRAMKWPSQSVGASA